LLQSEREHAKRTVILDDQADYFSNQTSAWLNEGEQDKARQEEEKRIQNLHHRKKQQLDVAF
jgi:two-component sensor histidine kinase